MNQIESKLNIPHIGKIFRILFHKPWTRYQSNIENVNKKYVLVSCETFEINCNSILVPVHHIKFFKTVYCSKCEFDNIVETGRSKEHFIKCVLKVETDENRAFVTVMYLLCLVCVKIVLPICK